MSRSGGVYLTGIELLVALAMAAHERRQSRRAQESKERGWEHWVEDNYYEEFVPAFAEQKNESFSWYNGSPQAMSYEEEMKVAEEASLQLEQRLQAESKITENDLTNRVVQTLQLEITGKEAAIFANELREKNRSLQLKIIQYLIRKYADDSQTFPMDPLLEEEIAALDTLEVFHPIPEVIRKLCGKTENVTVSPAQEAIVITAILESLKEFERTLLEEKENNLESKKQVTEAIKEAKEEEPKLAVPPLPVSSAPSTALSPVVSSIRANPQPQARQYQFTFLLADVSADLEPENKKVIFLILLQEYLEQHADRHNRARLLDLFSELRSREDGSPFQFLHARKNPSWDRFRLFFKSNRNGREEKDFWHTRTFQQAVKMVKKAYLLAPAMPYQLLQNRREQERYFIDYMRGNAPVHSFRTETRKSFGR